MLWHNLTSKVQLVRAGCITQTEIIFMFPGRHYRGEYVPLLVVEFHVKCFHHHSDRYGCWVVGPHLLTTLLSQVNCSTVLIARIQKGPDRVRTWSGQKRDEYP